jgi:hypothetical protein
MFLNDTRDGQETIPISEINDNGNLKNYITQIARQEMPNQRSYNFNLKCIINKL